jgi:hypothetical protein
MPDWETLEEKPFLRSFGQLRGLDVGGTSQIADR